MAELSDHKVIIVMTLVSVVTVLALVFGVGDPTGAVVSVGNQKTIPSSNVPPAFQQVAHEHAPDCEAIENTCGPLGGGEVILDCVGGNDPNVPDSNVLTVNGQPAVRLVDVCSSDRRFVIEAACVQDSLEQVRILCERGCEDTPHSARCIPKPVSFCGDGIVDPNLGEQCETESGETSACDTGLCGEPNSETPCQCLECRDDGFECLSDIECCNQACFDGICGFP